jgi:hypothetical protein
VEPLGLHLVDMEVAIDVYRSRRPTNQELSRRHPPDTQMRKLKIIEHISLDGVIQHSADDGDFPYSDWTAP